MKLSKQNQALIIGLLILIVSIIGIIFIEENTLKVVVAILGLVVLWFVTRSILKKPARVSLNTSNYDQLANDLVKHLGGLDNIEKVEHCQTRVLLTVKDSSLAQVESIRALGIAGVLIPSNTKVQLIVKELVEPIYKSLEKVVSHV